VPCCSKEEKGGRRPKNSQQRKKENKNQARTQNKKKKVISTNKENIPETERGGDSSTGGGKRRSVTTQKPSREKVSAETGNSGYYQPGLTPHRPRCQSGSRNTGILGTVGGVCERSEGSMVYKGKIYKRKGGLAGGGVGITLGRKGEHMCGKRGDILALPNSKP